MKLVEINVIGLEPDQASLAGGEQVGLAEIRAGRGVRYDATVADACIALFQTDGFRLEGVK